MIGWAEVRREPFRVFFPLGVLFGALGVGHWLAWGLGWLTTGSGFFHATLQVNGYLTGFIVGFLLTALPRFASAEPASREEFLGALALFLAQPVLLSLGAWVAAELCFAALLLLLLVFAGRRFASRRTGFGPPPEFLWVALAILHGLIGTALLVWGQLGGPTWALSAGRPMAQQGFLFGIVLGVGGFMAPRLMGRGFLPVQPGGADSGATRRLRRRRLTFHAVAGLLFFSSFWIESVGWIGPAYLLRAAVVTGELAWTSQFYRPPQLNLQYVRLLWMSLWLTVLGLWVSGIWPGHRLAGLHVAFLGGLSLMTFAVGTMVVFSHTGSSGRLNRSAWGLRAAAFGVAGSLVARVLADVHAEWYTVLLGMAALLWLAGAVAWLAMILPCVAKASPADSFTQAHEDAKRRLHQAST